jgi:hypothetical protein
VGVACGLGLWLLGGICGDGVQFDKSQLAEVSHLHRYWRSLGPALMLAKNARKSAAHLHWPKEFAKQCVDACCGPQVILSMLTEFSCGPQHASTHCFVNSFDQCKRAADLPILFADT